MAAARQWALGAHWPEDGAQKAEQAGVKVTSFHTVVFGTETEHPGLWVSRGSRRAVGSSPRWVERGPQLHHHPAMLAERGHLTSLNSQEYRI